MPLSETMTRILEAGIAAPSADNHHAFTYEVLSDHEILLWGRPEFYGADFQRQALTLISIGAVLENIAVRASAVGRTVVFEINTDGSASVPVVHMMFGALTGPASDLDSSLSARHTNRKLVFHGPPIPPSQLQELSVEAGGTPGAFLVWLSGQEKHNALDLIRRAESERFRDRYQHAELFRGVRFDIGWSSNCDEGLPPGALGVEPGLRAAFQALSYWRLMRPLNLVGAHWLLGLRAGYLPCRLAPQLGVVTASDESRMSLVIAGRAFQRTWLRLTQRGFALQPFAASTVFALQNNMAVRPEIRRVLRDGWKKLFPSTVPIMVFRAGTAAAPATRTARPSLENYLK